MKDPDPSSFPRRTVTGPRSKALAEISEAFLPDPRWLPIIENAFRAAGVDEAKTFYAAYRLAKDLAGVLENPETGMVGQ